MRKICSFITMACMIAMLSFVSSCKESLTEKEVRQNMVNIKKDIDKELPYTIGEQDGIVATMQRSEIRGKDLVYVCVLAMDTSGAKESDLQDYRNGMQSKENVDATSRAFAEGMTSENSSTAEIEHVKMIVEGMQKYGYHFVYKYYDINERELATLVVDNAVVLEELK